MRVDQTVLHHSPPIGRTDPVAVVAEGLEGVVAHGGVAGDGLHDPDLSCSHVEGEVLVVGRGAGEDQEDGVAQQTDAVLHTHDHLLPHPLGYQVVAQDDHDGPRYEPDREESEKWIIKSALTTNIQIINYTEGLTDLLWVMFECEEVSVDKHQVPNQPQDDQAVTEAGLVKVENLPGVEEELLHEEERHVHDGVAADEDGELDAGGGPQPGPGDGVALGQQEEQQEEADLGRGLQDPPGQFGRGRTVAVHPVAHVGEGGEGEAGVVEQHGEPEELEGGVQQLSLLLRTKQLYLMEQN